MYQDMKTCLNEAASETVGGKGSVFEAQERYTMAEWTLRKEFGCEESCL